LAVTLVAHKGQAKSVWLEAAVVAAPVQLGLVGLAAMRQCRAVLVEAQRRTQAVVAVAVAVVIRQWPAARAAAVVPAYLIVIW
jgi:hypothetical protein